MSLVPRRPGDSALDTSFDLPPELNAWHVLRAERSGTALYLSLATAMEDGTYLQVTAWLHGRDDLLALAPALVSLRAHSLPGIRMDVARQMPPVGRKDYWRRRVPRPGTKVEP